MLFIYGTLREGARNRHVIEKYVAASAPAEAKGRLFIWNNRYPFFFPGKDGLVVGEFVELLEPNEALQVLDEFEDPEYKRVEIEVTLENGEKRLAWAYVSPAADPAAEASFIESGDWLKYQDTFSDTPRRDR